jgi:hypothetical protein
MFDNFTDTQIEDAIARWTFGDGKRRKELREQVEKCFGKRGLKILSTMWKNRYLATDGYREVQVTGRWADNQNQKRVANEKTSDEK